MDTVIEKNGKYEVEIIDMGSEGEGVGKIGDFTVFVPNTVKGDKAEILMIKVKKSYGYGKLINLVEPSPNRREPICKTASKCGGCQVQHLDYKAQLEWKKKKVIDCITRIGGIKDVKVNDTIGMQEPYYYRNKAQYPIRKIDGVVKTGFFAPRSHRLVPIDHCYIQDRVQSKVLEIVINFLQENNISIYDEESHKGLVRHLVIRTGYYTKEVMVCLVINGKELPKSNILIDMLKNEIDVTSIVLNHNTNKDNTILGKTCTVLDGSASISDYIGDLKFDISPLSFFQVNPIQTKVLYDKALEYAALTGDETVWDAYCGIGTISLFLAQEAKKVMGVEIVKEAIENAKYNARMNGIGNAQFYVGKSEEVITTMYEEGVEADVVVVDPPRKGCEEVLLETFVKMGVKKIVYVSCDPATLGRDLGYLSKNGYKVEAVQPVDMFPHTTHVETVVKLSK